MFSQIRNFKLPPRSHDKSLIIIKKYVGKHHLTGINMIWFFSSFFPMKTRCANDIDCASRLVLHVLKVFFVDFYPLRLVLSKTQWHSEISNLQAFSPDVGGSNGWGKWFFSTRNGKRLRWFSLKDLKAQRKMQQFFKLYFVASSIPPKLISVQHIRWTYKIGTHTLALEQTRMNMNPGKRSFGNHCQLGWEILGV